MRNHGMLLTIENKPVNRSLPWQRAHSDELIATRNKKQISTCLKRENKIRLYCSKQIKIDSKLATVTLSLTTVPRVF